MCKESKKSNGVNQRDIHLAPTLNAHLAETQEFERRSLARALHDEIGQNVTAIGFNLDFIQSQFDTSDPNVNFIRARLESALMLVEQTTDRIRQIVTELRPPMLDEYGLIEALDWYADNLSQQSGIEIDIQSMYFAPRLPIWVENTLFRITQEALNNVIHHAQTDQASIIIEADATHIRLRITDNGIGFDRQQQTNLSENFGLQTMVERAKSVQGVCFIESQPNQGTQVIVEVPR
ncbi:MAG: sensor histidine kinase [Anaerolineae bacterium]|nr:sensor histidine kinase [Anaerolineae bacterium]